MFADLLLESIGRKCHSHKKRLREKLAAPHLKDCPCAMPQESRFTGVHGKCTIDSIEHLFHGYAFFTPLRMHVQSSTVRTGSFPDRAEQYLWICAVYKRAS